MKFLVFFIFICGCAEVGMLNETRKGLNSYLLKNSEDFSLEQIMVVTEADMNNHGAMRAHLVIVYDKELMHEISTMTAYRYFDMVDQLIKDHPDKMKIYSWDLIAEDRIRPWQKIDTLSASMSPLGGFIFADYHNSMMAQRARIPNYEKIKVIFGKDTFSIDYEDKSLESGKVRNLTEKRVEDYEDDDSWF